MYELLTEMVLSDADLEAAFERGEISAEMWTAEMSDAPWEDLDRTALGIPSIYE